MENSKLIYAFSFLLIWGRMSYSQDDSYGFLTDEDFVAAQLFTVEDFTLDPDFFLGSDDPNVIEGDMIVTPTKESAISKEENEWPQGRIPYQVSNSFDQNQKSVSLCNLLK